MAKQDPTKEPDPFLYSLSPGARVLIEGKSWTVNGGRRPPPSPGGAGLIGCTADDKESRYFFGNMRVERAPAAASSAEAASPAEPVPEDPPVVHATSVTVATPSKAAPDPLRAPSAPLLSIDNKPLVEQAPAAVASAVVPPAAALTEDPPVVYATSVTVPAAQAALAAAAAPAPAAEPVPASSSPAASSTDGPQAA